MLSPEGWRGVRGFGFLREEGETRRLAFGNGVLSERNVTFPVAKIKNKACMGNTI